MNDHALLWERWDEVDPILSAAIDLPIGERESLVHRAIPDPGPLRELVLQMVRNLDTEDPRVLSPPAEIITAAFGVPEHADDADLAPGTRVGRFVVRERLGRGGMATVYAAERADGAYEQRVALKVIRRGLDTADIVRRFRTERQILSSLAHPNVANLLDGGSLPDGRPWLAAELVEGMPITEYADVRRLGLRERLTLFLGVAEAVQAAHRRLIVHRDLKPSNILVDREGRVKLLDFGIAKVLDAEDAHTAVNARPLTPAYATPEQRDGGPITTATDVYQLGLLLRELFTGLPPATPASAGRQGANVSRLVTYAAPDAPDPLERAIHRDSTPQRLARSLRGDLDVVVSKALRPEPEERYASAGDLASDIRRYLEGLPVLAHPESAAYRTRKFVQRHRWGVAAAGALAMLLVAYVATLSVQTRRIAAQRDRAAREANKAAKVADFLVTLFAAADPNESPGREVTARDLLVDGADRLRDEGIPDPGLRAAMHHSIGRSFARLGDYKRAEEQLELAVAAHRSGGGVDGEGFARTLGELALVLRNRDVDSSVATFEEARRIALSTLGAEHPALANILVNYSVALATAHPGDPRIASMQSLAVAVLRTARTDVRDELANALTVWARGRPPEEAIPRMREALELRRAVHSDLHTTVAASLSDLALATESVDPLAADSLLTRAVDILLQIHGRRGTQLLATMNNLAALRRDRGAHAEAEPLYRDVLALRRTLYPEQRIPQAFTLYGLGVVLTETARAAEGEARLREALAILERELPRSSLVAVTRSAIGHALARQRRYAEAEVLLLAAWRGRAAPELGRGQQAEVLERVVALYEAWPRPAEAARFRQVLDSLRNGP